MLFLVGPSQGSGSFARCSPPPTPDRIHHDAVYVMLVCTVLCVGGLYKPTASGCCAWGLKSQRLAIATRQGDTLVGNQHRSTVARTYDTNVVAATGHLKTEVSTVRQNRTGVYEVDHMESTACLDQNCQLVPGASLCEL